MKIIETNITWNGKLTFNNSPRMIVDHHAEASVCTVEDIDRWHKARGWIGIGYHFLIKKDGSVYRGRPENAVGAHCLNFNTGSLGICFEGDYTREAMPDEQKHAGIELHKYLMKKYGIIKIEPHRALNITSCPGDKFPFDEIKNASSGQIVSGVNYHSIQNRTWLQVGDTGGKVMDIQKKLLKLGYSLGPGGADGDYGKYTKNAVYNFQHDKGLQEDGLAGDETITALNKAAAELKAIDIHTVKYLQHEIGAEEDNIPGPETLSKCPLIKIGSSGNAVKWIQAKLGIAADGIFGNQAFTEVKKFQMKYGITADGIVGPNTWEKLFSF